MLILCYVAVPLLSSGPGREGGAGTAGAAKEGGAHPLTLGVLTLPEFGGDRLGISGRVVCVGHLPEDGVGAMSLLWSGRQAGEIGHRGRRQRRGPSWAAHFSSFIIYMLEDLLMGSSRSMKIYAEMDSR
jgi:hypothetical protein